MLVAAEKSFQTFRNELQDHCWVKEAFIMIPRIVYRSPIMNNQKEIEKHVLPYSYQHGLKSNTVEPLETEEPRDSLS